MIGRRIPVDGGLDPFLAVAKAGDYYGPIVGYCGEGVPAVFFLLPTARDDGARGSVRALHHVCMPPHVFRECDDGSLEIRESIGASPGEGPAGGYVWHGYLHEGNRWEEC